MSKVKVAEQWLKVGKGYKPKVAYWWLKCKSCLTRDKQNNYAETGNKIFKILEEFLLYVENICK